MSTEIESRLRVAATRVNEHEATRPIPPFVPTETGRRPSRRGTLAIVLVAAVVLLIVGVVLGTDDDPVDVVTEPSPIPTDLFPGDSGTVWTYAVTRNGVPTAQIRVARGDLTMDRVGLQVSVAPPPGLDGSETPPFREFTTEIPATSDDLAVPLSLFVVSGDDRDGCTDVAALVIDPEIETEGVASLDCAGAEFSVAARAAPSPAATVEVSGSIASAPGIELTLEGISTDRALPARVELRLLEGVGLVYFDIDGSWIGTLVEGPTP